MSFLSSSKPKFTVSHTTIPSGLAHSIHVLLTDTENGQQYVLIGGSVDETTGMPKTGKLLPFDPSTKKPTDLSKYQRPDANAVKTLIENPEERDAVDFEKRYGFLPAEYFVALTAKVQGLSRGLGPRGKKPSVYDDPKFWTHA